MTNEQDSADTLATAITEAAYTHAAAIDRMAAAIDRFTKVVDDNSSTFAWRSLEEIAEAIDRHGAPLSTRSKAAADRVEALRQSMIRSSQARWDEDEAFQQ